MQQGKGQISRADLLKSLVEGKGESAALIAEKMGLKKHPKKYEELVDDTDTEGKHEDDIAEGAQHKQKLPTCRATEGFWYLKNRKSHKANEKKQLIVTRENLVIWRDRPTKAAKFIPLSPPKAILNRLERYVTQYQYRHAIDISQVTHKISRGEHLHRLPKQLKKQSAQQLHVIDDRQRHLVPYWRDHGWLKTLIPVHFPHSHYSQSVLQNVEKTPSTIGGMNNFSVWHQLPAQTTVLILSDLGSLSANPAIVDNWLLLGKQLQQKKCTAIALLPCEIEQCDSRLKRVFQLIEWQETTSQPNKAVVTDQTTSTATSTVTSAVTSAAKKPLTLLLTMLSPAIRIEPALLRKMRLVMGLSSAIESYLWQHPDIQEPHSVAATWVASRRKYHLQNFALLAEDQQTVALNIIRTWRKDLDQKIWFEEIISLDEKAQNLACIQADSDDARAYYQQISSRMRTANLAHDLMVTAKEQAYFKRQEYRLPEVSMAGNNALQQISASLHPHEVHPLQHQIDPRNQPNDEEKEGIKQCVLYQQGEKIGVDLYDPNRALQVTKLDQMASPLAVIKLRNRALQLVENSKGYDSLQLGHEDTANFPQGDSFTVISDMETLSFSQLFKPKGFNLGRDEFGIYTDITVKNTSQRFRYIPAGTFTMGSPSNEPEREPWDSSKETSHQVTLSQSFWMADTTVTQAFYQAVMGENPSRFNDDGNNPVETVSWEDAQHFINTLNQRIPNLQAGLPTEAQWEVCCRAGTTTPFSFGEMITPEQVNYNGEYPYHQGEKGLNRQKTVPVKSLPSNPWGLYEMHGNVWEWCEDAFKKDLGSEPVQDPLEGVGAERVIRGGSWNHYGRYVRSAFRDRYTPGFRDYRVGFRLILGHVSSSPAKTSKEEPSTHHQGQQRRDVAADPDGELMAEVKTYPYAR